MPNPTRALTTVLRINTDDFSAAMESLQGEIDNDILFREVADLLLRRFKTFFEFVGQEDVPALSGTRELWFRLQPTDRFGELVTAVRAGDLQRFIIE